MLVDKFVYQNITLAQVILSYFQFQFLQQAYDGNCFFKQYIDNINMSNLDQISETLRQQLGDVQKKIQSLKKLTGDDKFENANKYQKQLNRIKNLLQTYDFTIKDTIDEDNLGTHQSQFKEFTSKFNQLQKQLEFNRNQQVGQNQLFKNRSKATQPEGNQRQQMIQRGHRLQQQGMQGLQRVRKNVYEMDAMADTINTQLDRQINQLDTIYDNMKDTETTLKRAQKHLRYFARQVYTDRLMICLIVIIVIAIITIIVLKIIGKTPQVSIDQIK